MRIQPKSEKGGTLLEFALCAIPMIFIITSVFQMSLAMWNYHTLAEAIKLGTRAAAVKGVDCAGQACATTVGSLTQFIATHAVGLPAGSLTVKLTSTAGTITCSPISSCYSNAAAWPPTGGNLLNQLIQISGSLPVNTGIYMFIPGKGSNQFSQVTLGAVSQQIITF